MKALSIKQPWTELILQQKKTIELRKWNTHFRGRFYLHASKNPDKEMSEKYNLSNLALGAIVGEAILTQVKEYKTKKEFLKDSKKHLATEFRYGRYGFVLKNIKRIKPTPYKGKLNFFEVKL